MKWMIPACWLLTGAFLGCAERPMASDILREPPHNYYRLAPDTLDSDYFFYRLHAVEARTDGDAPGLRDVALHAFSFGARAVAARLLVDSGDGEGIDLLDRLIHGDEFSGRLEAANCLAVGRVNDRYEPKRRQLLNEFVVRHPLDQVAELGGKPEHQLIQVLDRIARDRSSTTTSPSTRETE